MGGGDLNLKKSWHPSTRANLERVYLAEVEAQKEQKKLEELQKEKRKERELAEIRKLKEAAGVQSKQADRLDWMYASPYSSSTTSLDKSKEAKVSVDSSAKVSDVDPMKSKDKKSTQTTKRWDLEAKIREDPLTKIQKKRKI